MPLMPEPSVETAAPPVNPEPQEVVEEQKQGEKRSAENDSEAIPFTKKFKNAPFGLLKRTDKPFLEKIAKAREEDEKKEAEEKKIEAEQKKEDAANKVLEIIKCFSWNFRRRIIVLISMFLQFLIESSFVEPKIVLNFFRFQVENWKLKTKSNFFFRKCIRGVRWTHLKWPAAQECAR